MKILMFGWEFPPFNFGGLGTACHGIVNGLTRNNTDVFFVIPKIPANKNISENIINADDIKDDNFKFIPVNSGLRPYNNFLDYDKYISSFLKEPTSKNFYGENLIEEVNRYASKARLIAKKYNCDIIHAHDWMSFPAGEIAKKTSDKPLIAHVHATEFDRTGDNPNQTIYDYERRGMEIADRIIAVIDKNLLLVVVSIRNGYLCVKNILPQDIGCGASDRVEGTLRRPSF
jgi:hypothetical protein